MNRLYTYRIIDSLILILAIITCYYFVWEHSVIKALALIIPLIMLLFLSRTPNKVFYRALATFCVLFLFEKYAASIFLLIIIAFIVRPPVYFLRTTIYSFWLVFIYLFEKNKEMLLENKNVLFERLLFLLQPFLYDILLIGFILGLILTYHENSNNKKLNQPIDKSTNIYVYLIGIFGLFQCVPLTLTVGVLVGLYQSFYIYVFSFLSILKIKTINVGSKNENYLVSKAMDDWKQIWRKTRMLNNDKVKKWGREIKEDFSSYGKILAFYYMLIHLMAIVTLTVGNRIIRIVFSLIHFILFAICKIFYLTIRQMFYLFDKSYRKVHQIQMVCPSCYHQGELPIYICPNCNASHEDLKPNRYGIFKRKCSCGHQLPTSILNGRSQLAAKCPSCEEEYIGKETTPIVIPIIGGKSAGKTSFWIKGVQQLSEIYFKQNSIRSEWNTNEQQLRFEQLKNQVNVKNSPPMTKELQPKAWILDLSKKRWSRNKLLHVFDASSASFDQINLMKKMKYISFADGLIFVIDATSLLSSNSQDGRSYGSENVEETIDRLLLYYQEEKGIKVHEKIKTPIAIIFHKAEENLIKQMEQQLSTSQQGKDAAHEACKLWLQSNGSQNFLRKINHQFTNYRFFITSSHTSNFEIQPVNAFVWLLNLSKKGLKLVERGE